MRRASQGLDVVSGFYIGGFAKGINDFDHILAVEHTRDVVGDSGHDLAAAAGRQVGEQRNGKLSADISKGIAVKEQEWSAAMTQPEEIKGFG